MNDQTTLPQRSAMHRDTPPGSRLEIANAYAVGELKTEAQWTARVLDRDSRVPVWLRRVILQVTGDDDD